MIQSRLWGLSQSYGIHEKVLRCDRKWLEPKSTLTRKIVRFLLNGDVFEAYESYRVSKVMYHQQRHTVSQVWAI